MALTKSGAVLAFVALALLAALIPGTAEFGAHKSARPKTSVLLVGWDGAEGPLVQLMMESGQLPNLARLAAKGGYADMTVDEGRTQTKPGWSQILTGYDTTTIGVTSNADYQPIPSGLTVFEKLRSKYGDGIQVLFISGKDNNLGARGPHYLCTNCVHRYENRSKTDWWEDNTTAPFTGSERVMELRKGEPYYNAVAAVDEYESGLGGCQNVAATALRWLGNESGPFFAFVHFEEPDEQGHQYGEGSKEYADALKKDDYWLGQLVSKAEERNGRGATVVIVTSDHGFDEAGFDHKDAPHTFLAANIKIAAEGTRRDVAPTILAIYGIESTPQMHGKSMAG